ncbi:ataxin-1-like [Xyrauchen texanus]|uniref:ataxin-1-like n=1 Tax=Xyrauchen texanus TaxID=154827 RepID=UPI002241A710|nr:ataxin-1-like [Xyrauchen texanus]XP_051956741.1 ataxin-1-like [Xyrauchen texanus]XP_051956742.1 ataxin-1-like [Xyrauchen texanus]XP_051956743.1 ataxin-1-like [Xyrauchen texanus]
MNPSPDRSKECLPPKKRESRKGSSEQQALDDNFKSPAPLRSRRHNQFTEGHRKSGDLLPPMLPPLSLSLPWQASYAPSMHHSYLPVQVDERKGSAPAPWRETVCGRGIHRGLEHPISHHSRWLRGDIPPMSLQPLISMPTFKSVYKGESREMWPYGPSQQDCRSTIFTSHLFPQPTVYPHESIPDSRLSYQGRRPNGFDGLDSRSGSSRRVPTCNDYRNDTMTSLDGSHANGRRRQEDTVRQNTWGGLQPRESTSAHSSPQDRDTIHPSSDAKTGKASQEHFGGSASQAGAQIYYALGSLYPTAHQNPKSFPKLHHSDPPSCNLRNSQHSPHSHLNSHGVEIEWDPSPGSYRPTVAVLTVPDQPPSAVLPHFAKGSLIELAGGRLKRVEELKTEDFLHSADTLPEFHLSTCTILVISPGPTHGFNHLQVLLRDRNTQEQLTVLAEYPFFVRDRGWSSCSPQRSAQIYGLQCQQLSTGDVCLALTPTLTLLHSTATLAHSSSQSQHSLARSGAGIESCTDTAERMPFPPAPTPLPAAQPSPSECPQKRKRHWSAPELQSGNETSSCLPQGYKHERWQ